MSHHGPGYATGVRSDPLAGAPEARRSSVLSYSTHLAERPPSLSSHNLTHPLGL